jgi:methanogenic corrinoid protein MtbC1
MYEIHEVSELTGLAAPRLRAWERRYEVVRPRRMPNGYRAYTADQVALLRAFARLIEAGERIGDLAVQPAASVLARAETRVFDSSPHGTLVDAARAFDRERLEGLVAQQLALRSLASFAGEIVVPMARMLGDLWATGRMPIAAEHLASEVVIHALKGALRLSRTTDPLVVAGCLPGERHEWGVLATLAAIQELGWRVQYLGPDLPVEALAQAAWKLAPRAIALSCGDPAIVRAQLPALAGLVRKLPPRTMAVIGGAGVEPHLRALGSYGFRFGLETFRGRVAT